MCILEEKHFRGATKESALWTNSVEIEEEDEMNSLELVSWKVVHDDGLGDEAGSILSRVILGIGDNKPTLEIIHNNVFHVETEIVTRKSLWERLMVHLN